MRRIALAFILSFITTIAVGQRKLQHIPYADLQRFHVGFSVGLQTQNFILTQSGTSNQGQERWFSEIPSYSPGFNVSLIGDAYLTSYLNLRIMPSLWLGEKKITFREELSAKEYTTHVRNNYVALPIQLKFAAPRYDNRRPYIILGGYGAIEVSPRRETPLPTRRVDYGVEIGGGYTIYLPYFRLSPELKFSFGLADLYPSDRPVMANEEMERLAQSVSGIKQRFITLTFHIE